MTDIPEEFSTRLIDWSPFVIMGNTMPPRDPDEDEEDEDNAFFNIALRQAKSLKDAFVVARSLVRKREVRERFEPSNPLMAGGDDRPLTCFAGIWTEFKGDRGTKSKPIPGPHQVYAF
jgi:putative SOS response-associated peptidase YedK